MLMICFTHSQWKLRKRMIFFHIRYVPQFTLDILKCSNIGERHELFGEIMWSIRTPICATFPICILNILSYTYKYLMMCMMNSNSKVASCIFWLLWPSSMNKKIINFRNCWLHHLENLSSFDGHVPALNNCFYPKHAINTCRIPWPDQWCTKSSIF